AFCKDLRVRRGIVVGSRCRAVYLTRRRTAAPLRQGRKETVAHCSHRDTRAGRGPSLLQTWRGRFRWSGERNLSLPEIWRNAGWSEHHPPTTCKSSNTPRRANFATKDEGGRSRLCARQTLPKARNCRYVPDSGVFWMANERNRRGMQATFVFPRAPERPASSFLSREVEV